MRQEINDFQFRTNSCSYRGFVQWLRKRLSWQFFEDDSVELESFTEGRRDPQHLRKGHRVELEGTGSGKEGFMLNCV